MKAEVYKAVDLLIRLQHLRIANNLIYDSTSAPPAGTASSYYHIQQSCNRAATELQQSAGTPGPHSTTYASLYHYICHSRIHSATSATHAGAAVSTAASIEILMHLLRFLKLLSRYREIPRDTAASPQSVLIASVLLHRVYEFTLCCSTESMNSLCAAPHLCCHMYCYILYVCFDT